MAEWTNLFDLGECTVTVHRDGSATAMTPTEMATAGVSVAADAAGLVTLTAPEFTGAGGTYEVRVTPNFDPAGAEVRISSAEDGPDGFPIGGTRLCAGWSPAPVVYGPDPWDEYVAQEVDITAAPGMIPYAFAPVQQWSYVAVAISNPGG